MKSLPGMRNKTREEWSGEALWWYFRCPERRGRKHHCNFQDHNSKVISSSVHMTGLGFQLCLTLYNTMTARLLCPWHFSGKNTGVGYSFSTRRSPTQDWIRLSCDFCIAGGAYGWATKEAWYIRLLCDYLRETQTCGTFQERKVLGDELVQSYYIHFTGKRIEMLNHSRVTYLRSKSRHWD